jgi:hypothetical protein
MAGRNETWKKATSAWPVTRKKKSKVSTDMIKPYARGVQERAVMAQS